jgi:hypothetical protein
MSDASTFDEICVLCGATDRPGSDDLDRPCPKGENVSHHYLEGTEEKHEGFTVRDLRGREPKETPCRVCGAPTAHTLMYNQPTMECIHYLRSEVTRVTEQLRREDI